MSPRCCAALKPLKLERLHRPPEPDCLRQRGRREASIWQLADVFVAMKDHEGSLHAAIRALAIGEKLGIYRDYPVSKGCTSPFAPIWINEMVRRQAE